MPARPAIVLKISNPLASHSAFAWPANWLLRRFSNCVDGVATMSTGLEADLRWLVPGHNIQTLFDPVYQNLAITDHLAAEGDGALQLLWVGRFEPQKDAQLALKTIDALRKQCPVRLTMLGDGAQRAQVLRLIIRMGLEHCVSAPGHMESIEPYMQRADALLITSHYEGGPAVAVEALAHGVPVVSTKCSHFLDDIITAREAGKIVDSREPELLAAALLALRDAGPPPAATLQALVAHLDPETCAAAYLAWLDTMVAARVG